MAALIQPPYKLLLGEGPGDVLDMAGWPGPQSPSDDPAVDNNYRNMTETCGRTAATGCLCAATRNTPTERRPLPTRGVSVTLEQRAPLSSVRSVGCFGSDADASDVVGVEVVSDRFVALKP